MKLSTVYTIICIMLSAGALGGASFAAWEMQQEVQANTSWRVIQIFERLNAVRAQRRLSQLEWANWCRAGIDLRVFRVCPPR